MNSHKRTLSNKLLAEIRSKAKKKAKQDKSRSYVEWLNAFAQPYGETTYKGLKKKVEAHEKLQIEEAEEMIWQERLSQPRPWEAPGAATQKESFPLPIFSSPNVIWPNSFCTSSLFTGGEGSRVHRDGKILSLDCDDMYFSGEELRCSPDETVMMSLIIISKRIACGKAFSFSLHDIERALGRKLSQLGMPFHFREIERSLWRLTHCSLKVQSANFDGPLLIFADTRKAPDLYEVRINPKFINFFYPIPVF